MHKSHGIVCGQQRSAVAWASARFPLVQRRRSGAKGRITGPVWTNRLSIPVAFVFRTGLSPEPAMREPHLHLGPVTVQFVERQFVGRIAVARRTRQSDTRVGSVDATSCIEVTRVRCLDDSSDESWWRVGRAKPDRRTGVVEATHSLEVTRTRCLAPSLPPQGCAWLRSHRAPGTRGTVESLPSPSRIDL